MKIFRRKLKICSDVIPFLFNMEFDDSNTITLELSKKSNTKFVPHEYMCAHLAEEVFIWLNKSEIQQAFGEIEIPEKYTLSGESYDTSDMCYYTFESPKNAKDVDELTELVKKFIVDGIKKCEKLNKEKGLEERCRNNKCLVYSDEDELEDISVDELIN